MEIPSATSFQCPRLTGFLSKLTGRGWLYSGTWKKRYCVLHGTKLYFYESEQSKGSERSAGVINLDYFDLCEEGTAKDSKRASNVFVIGTSVRGFFDNRHLFSAETVDEMLEWIEEVKVAINDARKHRSRAGKSRSMEKKLTEVPDIVTNQGTDGKVATDAATDYHLYHATKYRSRGPRGRRLPKRKTYLLEEANDLRPRSTSLSALESVEEDEEEDDRWLSVSMEAVDDPRHTRILVNSSSENVKGSRTPSTSSAHEFNTTTTPVKRDQLSTTPDRKANQFDSRKSAFLLELKGKLVKGGNEQKRPVSMWSASPSKTSPIATESHSIKNGTTAHNSSLAILHNRMDKMENEVAMVKKDVANFQESLASSKSEVKLIGYRVDSLEKVVPFEKLEEQLTSSLMEMQKMCVEARGVLKEALQARDEHTILAKECQEVLGKFKISANKPPMPQEGHHNESNRPES